MHKGETPNEKGITNMEKAKKKIIGMTDGRMYDLYADWIRGNDLDIEVIQLGYHQGNMEDIRHCQGLVFTGGEDLHPKYYQRMDYLPYCEPEDFDERRDHFEWELMDYGIRYALPILGICRGLQLINVYYGGSLIPDLPSWGKFNHAKLPEGSPRDHLIEVDPLSYLYAIVQQTQGTINSLHHQSADRVGKGLVASALSADGVIEALERKNRQDLPFLLAVQWHPERMKEQDNPFVKNIREAFLKAL